MSVFLTRKHYEVLDVFLQKRIDSEKSYTCKDKVKFNTTKKIILGIKILHSSRKWRQDIR